MRKTSNKPRRYADDAPLTVAELRTARPARQALPKKFMAAYKRKRGRPPGRNKAVISLSVDKELAATLRASGAGWQTRVNELLKAAVGISS
jgi:uncharacterized protein (DUF4415 family)